MLKNNQLEFNIVNTEHTMSAKHRDFRNLLKEFDEQTRLIEELEKLVKRTHKN